MEGKYWKRKLAAVTAEYKKWRMFYRNHSLGHAIKEAPDMVIVKKIHSCPQYLTYLFIFVLDTRPRCFNMEFAGFRKYAGG